MEGNTIQPRSKKTKIFLRNDRGYSLSVPKKIKDQIKKDILEMLNQGPVDELETEFLSKNRKNPRDDFLIYKKDVDTTMNIQDILKIKNRETNYLIGQVAIKDRNLYYLVDIGELVEIMGKKKIMMISKNIQVKIIHVLKGDTS